MTVRKVLADVVVAPDSPHGRWVYLIFSSDRTMLTGSSSASQTACTPPPDLKPSSTPTTPPGAEAAAVNATT